MFKRFNLNNSLIKGLLYLSFIPFLTSCSDDSNSSNKSNTTPIKVVAEAYLSPFNSGELDENGGVVKDGYYNISALSFIPANGKPYSYIEQSQFVKSNFYPVVKREFFQNGSQFYLMYSFLTPASKDIQGDLILINSEFIQSASLSNIRCKGSMKLIESAKPAVLDSNELKTYISQNSTKINEIFTSMTKEDLYGNKCPNIKQIQLAEYNFLLTNESYKPLNEKYITDNKITAPSYKSAEAISELRTIVNVDVKVKKGEYYAYKTANGSKIVIHIQGVDDRDGVNKLKIIYYPI
jgi:hypothetical protein